MPDFIDTVENSPAALGKGSEAGVFDAGGNTIIADDGATVFPGGESLVRIGDP